MTPQRLAIARAIHEAKIALCWGPKFVGVREPWPNFGDPAVLRAYPHSPIAYVDIALAQADAAWNAPVVPPDSGRELLAALKAALPLIVGEVPAAAIAAIARAEGRS